MSTWDNFPWGYIAGLFVALLITLWLTRDREWNRAMKRRTTMPEYAEGGYIRPGLTTVRNDSGEPEPMVPVQLSRGCVVMSQASLDALGPDMIKKLFPNSDVVTAEELLEKCDAEEGED